MTALPGGLGHGVEWTSRSRSPNRPIFGLRCDLAVRPDPTAIAGSAIGRFQSSRCFLSQCTSGASVNLLPARVGAEVECGSPEQNDSNSSVSRRYRNLKGARLGCGALLASTN
jgi:hypothetical protein